jgi:hypothetical protein
MALLRIGQTNQLKKNIFADQLALASCLSCLRLKTLPLKELVDWRSASILWLALLRQLGIFLQEVDTALCQEVRWPIKLI